jgi:hypothetical protein
VLNIGSESETASFNEWAVSKRKNKTENSLNLSQRKIYHFFKTFFHIDT